MAEWQGCGRMVLSVLSVFGFFGRLSSPCPDRDTRARCAGKQTRVSTAAGLLQRGDGVWKWFEQQQTPEIQTAHQKGQEWSASNETFFTGLIGGLEDGEAPQWTNHTERSLKG